MGFKLRRKLQVTTPRDREMLRLKKKVCCQLNSRTKKNKKYILKIMIINERNTPNSIFC